MEKRKNIPVNLFNELKAIHDCNEVYNNYKGSLFLRFPDELRLKLHDYDYSESKCIHIYYFRDKQISMYMCDGDIVDIFIDKWDRYADDWISVDDEMPEEGRNLVVKVIDPNNEHSRIYKKVRYGEPYIYKKQKSKEFYSPHKYYIGDCRYDKILKNVVCWCYEEV